MTKRILAILLAALCIATSLSGCKKGGVTIKDDEYLAGGTIPAAAKIYPVYDETISMVKHDEDNVLTDEDIYTITRYVDLFSSLDDSAGDGYDEAELGFITSVSVDDIISKAKLNNENWEVLSTQILALDVLDNGEVQAATIKRLKGSSKEYEEGEYDVVGGLFFKKTNGAWYENGIAFVTMQLAGTLQIEKDDISGNYVISNKNS